VTIPDDVNMNSDEVFDPAAMQMLYDVGYRLALAGGGWATTPPGRLSDPAPP
jgi:hypothetical protein